MKSFSSLVAGKNGGYCCLIIVRFQRSMQSYNRKEEILSQFFYVLIVYMYYCTWSHVLMSRTLIFRHPVTAFFCQINRNLISYFAAWQIRHHNFHRSNRFSAKKSGFSLLLVANALLSPTSQAHPGHDLKWHPYFQLDARASRASPGYIGYLSR